MYFINPKKILWTPSAPRKNKTKIRHIHSGGKRRQRNFSQRNYGMN